MFRFEMRYKRKDWGLLVDVMHCCYSGSACLPQPVTVTSALFIVWPHIFLSGRGSYKQAKVSADSKVLRTLKTM